MEERSRLQMAMAPSVVVYGTMGSVMLEVEVGKY